MRRRGAMEPHAGSAEMVGPTAEAERGERERFWGLWRVGKSGMAIAEGKLCNQSVLTPDESYFCKAGLLSQCSGFKFLPSPGCPLLVF